MDESAGEIVLLVTAPNEPIARMWVEVLRAEGVRVLLRAEGPGIGAWGSEAMFPHQLYVRASDLERAQTVLDELAVADDAEPLDAWDEDGEDAEEPRSSS